MSLVYDTSVPNNAGSGGSPLWDKALPATPSTGVLTIPYPMSHIGSKSLRKDNMTDLRTECRFPRCGWREANLTLTASDRLQHPPWAPATSPSAPRTLCQTPCCRARRGGGSAGRPMYSFSSSYRSPQATSTHPEPP